MENFVNLYGTGNQITRPPNFVPTSESSDPQIPGPPTIKLAEFTRVSQRPAPVYLTQGADPNHSGRPSSSDATQPVVQTHINGHDNPSHASHLAPQSSPPNQPLPPISNHSQPLTSRNSISASSRMHRQSVPLPDVPQGGSSRNIERSQTPPPPIPQQPSGNTILFYG